MDSTKAHKNAHPAVWFNFVHGSGAQRKHPDHFPLELSDISDPSPFCTSFAAGNTAILKPSELTPHTSAALAELIAEIFDPKEAAVVQGGVEVATELLDTRFDHIFFTGSTAVGKIVMQAAAKHLTSVTLELGGKSPTIIDNSANAYSAGQRIAWAKFTNAGQICIAPDHIYVHEAKLEDFKKGVQEALDRFYGSEPTTNPDYVQIVNNRHFKRLTDMMEAAKPKKANFSTAEKPTASSAESHLQSLSTRRETEH